MSAATSLVASAEQVASPSSSNAATTHETKSSVRELATKAPVAERAVVEQAASDHAVAEQAISSQTFSEPQEAALDEQSGPQIDFNGTVERRVLHSNTNKLAETKVLRTGESASDSRAQRILKRWQVNPTEDDMRKHPLLRFKMFANKPLPPVRSFLFLLFVSLVVSEIFPSRLRQAKRQCSKNFWKCFWGGILATLLFCILGRVAYFSEIGMPLVQVTIGILQLLLLAGFTVTSNLIGQALLTFFRVKIDAGSERQWLRRLGEPFIGAFLLSMLLIIPPLGILPRIGVRLILLFCFLGMGAWFRTGMGTKELDTASEV